MNGGALGCFLDNGKDRMSPVVHHPPGCPVTLADTELQLGEIVVVEGDGPQLGQHREHGLAHPVELVVVEIQQLQGLQTGQL